MDNLEYYAHESVLGSFMMIHDELMLKIFEQLELKDILNVRNVNNYFKRISDDRRVTIVLENLTIYRYGNNYAKEARNSIIFAT
jgi:hypothetical protein